MASISGASSKNYTSSLYNSANVISGLASGMDTEGMIESLVQSYQNKIQNLQNKSTKLGWKQEAYRSIISKMNAFSNKYTSYTSSTNLMSSSFFNNAINVTPKGNNAGKVTASGRTDSDVVLNSVNRLATSARYATTSSLKGGGDIAASEGLDLSGDITLGTMKGSLELVYGSKSVSISFDEISDQIGTDYDGSKAEALAESITEKLAGQQITLSSGETVAASDRIGVKVEGSKISFYDKSGAGNEVYISGASDSVKETLGLGDLENAEEDKLNSIQVTYDTAFTKEVNVADYLSNKTMNINLDGTTKSIRLPQIVKDGGDYKIKTADGKKIELNAENYTNTLNDSLKKAFGGKVSVENLDTTGDTLQLKFNAPKNSNLLINADAGATLGIGKVATNYLNTSNTLGDLLDENAWSGLEAAKDSSGKELTDAMGDKLYAFKINGVTVGNYNEKTKLSDIMSDINANTQAGVKVSYSKTTREFVFTSKDTGSENKIEIEAGGLAAKMFGEVKDGTDGYAAGQDAEFVVTVNGTTKSMTRGSNRVDIDGMTLNFKETFNEEYDAQKVEAGEKPAQSESVSFERTTDSDKIVDAIKSMITDYNEMMSEIRKQYATLPAQNSNGSIKEYEPLSDDDMAGMSESAIQRYEEKAKQGLLFGDSNLRNLYERMRNAFAPSGADSAVLSKIGITVGYDSTDGASYISLDEKKLREALDSDPDAVADAFTKSKTGGAETDGIMQTMKTQLDRYAGLTGEVKGILVQQAGTPLNSLSLLNNQWQKEMDNIGTEIEKWQDKLTSQVDRYTSMFSKLEVLINQMNSQSSTLAGMMGG